MYPVWPIVLRSPAAFYVDAPAFVGWCFEGHWPSTSAKRITAIIAPFRQIQHAVTDLSRRVLALSELFVNASQLELRTLRAPQAGQDGSGLVWIIIIYLFAKLGGRDLNPIAL
jgi:hypothetical protein